MSAQKLVAEADKLLERGKYPEAIEKLKGAIAADPLNQLIATKLANAFVESEDLVSAKKVLVSAAHRLSEAGKSQVAIAIYKQALELAPNDIELRTKFALECESVGKVGDAVASAQMVLKHYLLRKKYFDAANILPLIVRNQSKDEKMKLIWVEVMQLSLADQKLIHLLVALAGPPGLVSQEFPVGGEPTAMSENLYQAFKQLVDWFPSDAKIAYSVAWCAQKRGNEKEFYHYLRECLRREPDFCLALLLFARVLAEKQKLNESLFVYKHLRERLGSDRTVDMLTLTRLVEGFVEKNGWISFTEGMMSAGEYTARDFVAGFTNPTDAPASAPPIPDAPMQREVTKQTSTLSNISISKKSKEPTEELILPPQEIELSPAQDSGAAANATLEIQLTSGEKIVKNPFEELIEKEDDKKEMDAYNPDLTKVGDLSSTAKAPPSPVAAPVPAASAPQTPSVAVAPIQTKEPEQKISVPLVAPKTDAPVPETNKKESAQPTTPAAASAGFNPLSHAQIASNSDEINLSESNSENTEAKTVLFSPMEAVQATNQKKSAVDDPKTQLTEQNNDATVVISQPSKQELALPEVPVAIAEQPADASPSPALASEQASPAEPATNATGSLNHSAILQSTPTVLYNPVEAVEAGVNSRKPYMPAAATPAEDPSVIANNVPAEAPVEEKKTENAPASFGGAFVPIPQMSENANAAQVKPATPVNEGGADLGDDLLEGPTRVLTNLDIKDATAHLLKEIQDDSKAEEATLSPDILLKKAERYIAKRNYYLARKAVRHAHALGADENLVKEKLREIRKLEMPDGLYAAVSTDLAKDEGVKNLLDKLEEEFNLKSDDSAAEIDQLKNSIKTNFDEIFKESDPRTIMDFGVGLHEMGLYKEAESFFIRMVNDHPDQSFDAYYLAAISKFARKDYAGAVSILKKLSLAADKSDKDKISIYYTLGEVFEKMQQNERSKSFYEKVAALDANYRNIRDKLEK